jgi:hypothetical protein
MTATDPPDRYRSFQDIDCYGGAAAVVERLRRHLADPAHDNALWQRFIARLGDAARSENPKPDILFLVCSHVYYIADLFEAARDDEGMALMQQLEFDCC